MRAELERLHWIEHHLLGSPPPNEAVAWTRQQLLDTELAADTEAQQLLYQGIRLAGRRQLRRELAAIHQRLYRPRYAWLRTIEAGLTDLLGRFGRAG